MHPPRLLLIVLLGLTFGWLGSGSLSAAQESTPANESAPVKSTADGPQAGPAETLVVEQEQVADRFKKLEEALLRMAELTQQEDPRRAELLRKVVAHSKESHIAAQLDEIARLLEKEQLFQAGKDQAEAHQNLTKLLELLLSEDRGKRIESEKERIRNYLSRVNRIIKDQKDLQGQTPDAIDPKPLATKQGSLAEKTGQLSKDMRAAAREKLTDGQNDGAQGDSKDAKDGDKQDDASQKDKEKSADKDGDKKNSDKESADKDNSESEKSSDQKDNGQSGKSDSQDKNSKADSKNQQGNKKDQNESSDKKQSDGKPQDQDGKQDQQQQDGQPQDGQQQDGQQQKGKQSQGKSQQGRPQQGQPQEDQQEEPEQGQEQSSSGESAARKRIQAAEQRMEEAKKKLEEALKKDAVDKQEEALRQLEQAKAELEQILRQLREEEVERMLAMLEARFRKMLEMQTEVYNGTKVVDATPEADRDRDIEIETGRLGRKESAIVVEADKALTLMREEGSAVAFPEAVTQMRDDMEQVVSRLAASNTGKITQGIEEDIIKALEEMIASLKQAQKDAQQRKGMPMQQQQEGQEQDEPLVDKIAELKMIRALQLRVNTRHDRYSKLVEGEQAEDSELIDALLRLKDRQLRIHRTTRDIVVGRNK